MTDLAHTFGGDLSISPTGDLALSTGAQAAQDRVLRRLLTNPGDYLWQLDYGAGLAAMIGQPANGARISAIARGQMMREATVARSPSPVVTTDVQPTGVVSLSLQFVYAPDRTTQTLSFPVA